MSNHPTQHEHKVHKKAATHHRKAAHHFEMASKHQLMAAKADPFAKETTGVGQGKRSRTQTCCPSHKPCFKSYLERITLPF